MESRSVRAFCSWRACRGTLGSLVLLAIVATAAGGCQNAERLPAKSSPEYRDAVSAFYVGLAALQTSQDAFAKEKFTRVTQLVPGEPAAWANLGLVALRQHQLDEAAEKLEKARTLAPDNRQIQVLLSVLESGRGRLTEAIGHLRRAVELDPSNLKATYALARELERQGEAQSEADARRLMEKILEAQPDNLAVRLELARLAAKRGDVAALRQTVNHLAAKAGSWPSEVRQQLEALRAAAAESNLRLAARHVTFLRNVLLLVAEYRDSLAAVMTPGDEVAEPIMRFIRLPSPTPSPAPPDESLAFAGEPLPLSTVDRAEWTGAVSLTGDSQPVVVTADGRQVRLPHATLTFPGGSSGTAPMADGVLAADITNDFRTDLVLAGAGGLRLFRQDDGGAFTDVTRRTGLPAAVTGASLAGAWAADIEADGDLDIVLGPSTGPPIVLRNNGDGTFSELRPFPGLSELRAFAWADLDGEGVPDAALLDARGEIRVFLNQRAGQFRSRPVPSTRGRVVALNVGDVNGDGVLDLLALRDDGVVIRLSPRPEQGWDQAEIAGPAVVGGSDPIGAVRLLVADLDNNGGLDLVASGPRGGSIWLSDAAARFSRLSFPLEAHVFSVSDLTGDGRLDLIGRLPSSGRPVRLVNRGGKPYSWQVLRARAEMTAGDQRINSFGIGGEIEIRSGLLVQKQPITTPFVHFGLGDQTGVEVARILWPNGFLQSEFALQANQTAVATQRLKGSCPWLFADDGTGMRFVTDFLWRSPLGLRINAQDTADTVMTEDWVKIRGDQLIPRDGVYDLRITAELWETHFFDHVSLMVVDHPEDTAVFVDERFAIPPPALAVHATARPRPVAGAWDDAGQDVTHLLRDRDGRHVDSFGRGQYQGVTRDHYLEIEIGAEAPSRGPLWLIATGWVRPTDSSINVALGQGNHPPPQGLRLEVPDGRGGWTVVRRNLGFPAGKAKTILIDLDGVLRPGTPRRLRLGTNLEIYWDTIEWAPGRPASRLRTQRLSPSLADLRYRGFSAVSQSATSAPEVPEYSRLEGTAPRWRDLIGYHTRFGDVRELVRDVDDRYVIMNAGDELALRFPAPPPPSPGWVRDFVLIGDGWVKDGDYNTAFSRTVLPLPAHDRRDYTRAPRRLEDDTIYHRHSRDWQDYHTRYVTPMQFQTALRRGITR